MIYSVVQVPLGIFVNYWYSFWSRIRFVLMNEGNEGLLVQCFITGLIDLRSTWTSLRYIVLQVPSTAAEVVPNSLLLLWRLFCVTRLQPIHVF